MKIAESSTFNAKAKRRSAVLKFRPLTAVIMEIVTGHRIIRSVTSTRPNLECPNLTSFSLVMN